MSDGDSHTGTPRAVVTGLGAVSGFGRGVAPLWSGLIDGASALCAQPVLAAAGLDVGPVALVAEVPFGALPEAASTRAAAFALDAAREALADAGAPPRGDRFAVVCGTTLGGIDGWLGAVRAEAMVEPLSPATAAVAASARRGWSYAGPAHALAHAFDASGPVIAPSIACASGNVALGIALDLVRSGRCDVVLAGGADALNDFVLHGFATLKALDPSPCRPFDRARKGLNLGEGAAMLVIEAEAHARARGARIRAYLDGYGLSADAVHMTGPDREGRGAARAMVAALRDAGAAPADVGYLSAHGTATVFNDLMESKAIAGALGAAAATVPVGSIKGALGHTLGAAAAIEALVCVRALECGSIPPTTGLVERDPEIALDVVQGRARPLGAPVALSTSSGFGGTNAAVLLRGA